MNFLLSLIFLIYTSLHSANARDLGSYGKTLEIREPDLLKTIELKLAQQQNNGTSEEFHNQYANALKKQITAPNRVLYISKAEKENYRKFDPTIELEEDIVIAAGKEQIITYPKGMKVNPLHYMKFDEPLLFIDGEDRSQIEFAHNYFDKNQKAKIILINGRPGLQELEGKEYYHFFDQWGAYSAMFSVHRVPSVIFQENEAKFLTVWEVKLP